MSDERFSSSLPPSADSSPGDADWFVLSRGQEHGPFTVEELEDLAESGTLSQEDHVRKGSGSWLPANTFPFLVIHMPAGLAIKTRAGTSMNDERPGIGGWLLLFSFGLVVAPFFSAFAIYQDLSFLRELPPANLQLALSMQAVLFSALLVFQVYVAVAFFRHKSAAPTLVIALLVTNIALNIIDSLMVASILRERPAFEGIGSTLIAAAVWIPYFLLSKRVKATFIVGAKEPLWHPTDSRSDTSLDKENDQKESHNADTAFRKPNR